MSRPSKEAKLAYKIMTIIDDYTIANKRMSNAVFDSGGIYDLCKEIVAQEMDKRKPQKKGGE